MDLVEELYQVTTHFPKEEIYGLQVRCVERQFRYLLILRKAILGGIDKNISNFFAFSLNPKPHTLYPVSLGCPQSSKIPFATIKET